MNSRLFGFADGKQEYVDEYNSLEFGPETALQGWLEQTPNALLDEPLLVIGREVSTRSGPVDLLALDQFGNTVVIEVKVGDTATNSTTEDKILGQPQRYAQAIHQWDSDRLADVYEAYQREVTEGRWPGGPHVGVDDDLEETFWQVLGTELDVVNHYQRLVIAAERITWQTAENARYLLHGEGAEPLVQCVQVQQFVPPAYPQERIVMSSLVVDYDSGRVRPPTHSNPVYAEANARIADLAVERLQDTIHADSTEVVFPSGFEQREPGLVSKHPTHPEEVRYSIRVKPDGEKGTIQVTLDVHTDDLEILEMLEQNAERFEQRGFETSGGSTHRVWYDEWSVSSVEELYHEGLLNQVVDRFVELVELGHAVLTETPQ